MALVVSTDILNNSVSWRWKWLLKRVTINFGEDFRKGSLDASLTQNCCTPSLVYQHFDKYGADITPKTTDWNLPEIPPQNNKTGVPICKFAFANPTDKKKNLTYPKKVPHPSITCLRFVLKHFSPDSTEIIPDSCLLYSYCINQNGRFVFL